MAHPLIVLAVVVSALLAAPCGAAEPVVRFDDPSFDDKGGGELVYPTEPAYQERGLFDLRRLDVKVEGDYAIFEVTLGARIVKPQAPRFTDAVILQLENGLYVQNIDIYIDRDPRPGAGHTEALPGRNVRIHRDHAWDQAVVLTPRPFALKSSIAEWPAARDVLVPSDLTSRNSTVVARVPLIDLGGPPQDHWGWQVMVTGALWVNGLQAYGHMLDSAQPNAFTMRVTPVAERFAFGGGDVVLHQPHVIDLLAPEGSSQRAILRGYTPERAVFAAVPMVYPDEAAFQRERAKALKHLGPVKVKPVSSAPAVGALLPGGMQGGGEAAASAPPEGHFELAIRDVQDDIVVLEKPAQEDAGAGAAVKAFKVGTVVDFYGRSVGKVVVTAIYPKFVTATPIEGKAQMSAGARVRFKKETAP